jgi:hypothetical protein
MAYEAMFATVGGLGAAVAIAFQMGRARFAARGTALKSMALARLEARSIVLSAGPAR